MITLLEHVQLWLSQPFFIQGMDWLGRLMFRSTILFGLLWVLLIFIRRGPARLSRLLMAAAVVPIGFLLIADFVPAPVSLPVLPDIHIGDSPARIPASASPISSNPELLPIDNAVTAELSVARTDWAIHPAAFINVLFIVWAFGVTWKLLKIMRAHLQASRLIRCGRAIQLKSVHILLRSVKEETGCTYNVGILFSDDIVVPMIAGLARPTILLPSCAAEWSRERLLTALRHEIIHVQRRDLVVKTVWQVLSAFLWIQPLSWPVRSATHQLIEEACDEAVIDLGTEKTLYAEHLFILQKEIKGGREPALSLSMGGSSQLLQRIQVLLTIDPARRGSSWPVMTAGIVLLLITAVLYLADYSQASTPLNLFSYRAETIPLNEDRISGIVETIDSEQPPTPSAILRVDQLIRDSGNTVSAETLEQVEAMLLQNPNAPEAWNWLAFAWLRNNQPEAAMRAAQAAWMLRPGNKHNNLALGLAAYSQNQFDRANHFLFQAFALGLRGTRWMETGLEFQQVRPNAHWQRMLESASRGEIEALRSDYYREEMQVPFIAALPAPEVNEHFASLAWTALHDNNMELRQRALVWLSYNASTEAEAVLSYLERSDSNPDIRRRAGTALKSIRELDRPFEQLTDIAQMPVQ